MIDNEFKFIHSADIHLGSIIHCDTNDVRINERLVEEVYSSFRRIIQYALDKKVDFLILAGDIFDSDIKPIKARKVFYEEALKLYNNNINLYYISGNHDPFSEEIELFKLPPNVHCFSSKEAIQYEIEKDGKIVARIIGQSYKNKWDKRKMHKEFLIKDNSAFNIGVLHTSLEEDGRYVPSSLNELVEIQEIDYWALGHIHKRKILNKAPYIVYPGIPQGRDIGEQGVGGCYLVSVEKDKNCKMEMLTTSKIIWQKIEVDISGLRNLNEIELKIIEVFEDILEKNNYEYSFIVKLNINGETNLNKKLREDNVEITKVLIESINKQFNNGDSFIIINEIDIKTKEDFINKEQLVRESEVLSQLQDTVELIINDMVFLEDLKENFGAIYDRNLDEEIIDEEKFKLTDELTIAIIDEAKDMITKQLLEWGDVD
ncbi:metallophosphoesterase family protein [Clostridium sp. DL1XJH146]